MTMKATSLCCLLFVLLLFSSLLSANQGKFIDQQLKKAGALVERKDYAAAIAELRRAMFVSDALCTQKKELWHLMGYCYFIKQEYRLTVDCFKTAYVCSGFFDKELKEWFAKEGIKITSAYRPKYLGVFYYQRRSFDEPTAQEVRITVTQKQHGIKIISRPEWFFFDTEVDANAINTYFWLPGLVAEEAAKCVITSPLRKPAPFDITSVTGIIVPDHIYIEFLGELQAGEQKN